MLPSGYREALRMQIKTMGDIGALVRSARTARGMTQADLAEQLHMGRDWVVRLEKGHPRLEAQRVLDALRVVGVTLEAAASETETGSVRKRGHKAAAQKSTAASPAPPDPFDALFGTKNG
ncbi:MULTISPECIES: helix-turn-helix domain-containing protein [Mycolicibacterium]|jgi:transcriptional regulator with XRE-family HTH domain|nr:MULTISPECIES: helix-turn-helix domain-containing protein [Mycolicibacterium]PQP50299.1 transcriptional regulator [Mycolicibacterium austroafricanum]QZT57923.1 helix-turn-helix domain-containing protein [Mycolicibacterium austroafricanum]